MISNDSDILINWTRSNAANDNLQLRTIQSRIRPYLERKSMKNSEIEEILLAEGYKENLIKEALRLASSTGEDDKVVKEAFVGIPKTYGDLAPKFEAVLAAKGPTRFVKMLTEGQSPIVKLSRKELDSFHKIADKAFDNPMELPVLHAFLKPSVISELAENVCRARKIRQNCKVAETKEGYKIAHKNKTIIASAKPISSTSEKFASGNYEAFGFPDEYVIIAHEEASPYSQIQKDLQKF
jgi:hypothetical protein